MPALVLRVLGLAGLGILRGHLRNRERLRLFEANRRESRRPQLSHGLAKRD